ncbi:hypothetical protein GF342_05655, partial [Candidatus Woesearchaeota archaeon]|nr:hypothetical protein [Candidatus Woesearchaeota archaeon]
MKKENIVNILVLACILLVAVPAASAVCTNVTNLSVIFPNGGYTGEMTTFTWDTSMCTNATDLVSIRIKNGPCTADYNDYSDFVSDLLNDGSQTINLSLTETEGEKCHLIHPSAEAIFDVADSSWIFDSTPQTITSVVGTTVQGAGDTIAITFDGDVTEASVENVSNWVLESPDGDSLFIADAAFVWDDPSDTLTVTLDESLAGDDQWLKNGDTVCVTPSGVEDAAGNLVASTEVCGAANVTGDLAAPSVTSVDFSMDNTSGTLFSTGNVLVTATFDEDMDDTATPLISIDRPGTGNDVTDAAMTMNLADRSEWTYTYALAADNGGTILDGQVNVTVHSGTDLAGNLQSNDTSNFDADTVAPDSSHDYAASGWQTSNVTVTVTESDPAPSGGIDSTLYCTDTDNTCTPSTDETGGFNVVFSADGTHYLRFYTVDAAGNTQANQSVQVLVDQNGPTTVNVVATPGSP